MTVPVQRGSSSEDSTVLNLVLDAVREVKDQVVYIGARLDGLDQRYVPRVEYEARHSDVRNGITKVEASIDAEAKERKALEEKLTASRRFVLMASGTGAMAVIGLLSLILANLPR